MAPRLNANRSADGGVASTKPKAMSGSDLDRMSTPSATATTRIG
jgi:deoxyribodipyrimidine photolyase-like uncharacterized protein